MNLPAKARKTKVNASPWICRAMSSGSDNKRGATRADLPKALIIASTMLLSLCVAFSKVFTLFTVSLESFTLSFSHFQSVCRHFAALSACCSCCNYSCYPFISSATFFRIYTVDFFLCATLWRFFVGS